MLKTIVVGIIACSLLNFTSNALQVQGRVNGLMMMLHGRELKKEKGDKKSKGHGQHDDKDKTKKKTEAKTSKKMKETPTPTPPTAPASNPTSRTSKYTLVLVRHGESIWNKENKFTGWHDVALSPAGEKEAVAAGVLLQEQGFTFDKGYTSYLKRAIKTLWNILEETDQMWIPVIRSWRLNERHYGALTGLDKKETVAKYGAEKVALWRRSYDIPPPALDESSEYYPGNDRRYATMDPLDWPKSESLACTAKRFMPVWENEIVPDMKSGKNLIIAAHGNSLRALVQHLEGISAEKITELNIPTGIPLVYELDDNMVPIPHPDGIGGLSGRYLGDQEAIAAKILGVKNQSK